MLLAWRFVNELRMIVVNEWKLLIDDTRNRSITSFHPETRDRESKTRDREFLFFFMSDKDARSRVSDYGKQKN